MTAYECSHVLVDSDWIDDCRTLFKALRLYVRDTRRLTIEPRCVAKAPDVIPEEQLSTSLPTAAYTKLQARSGTRFFYSISRSQSVVHRWLDTRPYRIHKFPVVNLDAVVEAHLSKVQYSLVEMAFQLASQSRDLLPPAADLRSIARRRVAVALTSAW